MKSFSLIKIIIFIIFINNNFKLINANTKLDSSTSTTTSVTHTNGNSSKHSIKQQSSTNINELNKLKDHNLLFSSSKSNLIFSPNISTNFEKDQLKPINSCGKSNNNNNNNNNNNKDKSMFNLDNDMDSNEKVSILDIIILYNILLVPPFFILITIIFYNYNLY